MLNHGRIAFKFDLNIEYQLDNFKWVVLDHFVVYCLSNGVINQPQILRLHQMIEMSTTLGNQWELTQLTVTSCRRQFLIMIVDEPFCSVTILQSILAVPMMTSQIIREMTKFNQIVT